MENYIYIAFIIRGRGVGSICAGPGDLDTKFAGTGKSRLGIKKGYDPTNASVTESDWRSAPWAIIRCRARSSGNRHSIKQLAPEWVPTLAIATSTPTRVTGGVCVFITILSPQKVAARA